VAGCEKLIVDGPICKQKWENCRVVFKTGILCSFQNRTDLHGTIGEKKDGEFFWIRSGGQHRVVARGVEAEDD
jgi:hypothetical protein